jgi:hypothetical protein
VPSARTSCSVATIVVAVTDAMRTWHTTRSPGAGSAEYSRSAPIRTGNVRLSSGHSSSTQ